MQAGAPNQGVRSKSESSSDEPEVFRLNPGMEEEKEKKEEIKGGVTKS